MMKLLKQYQESNITVVALNPFLFADLSIEMVLFNLFSSISLRSIAPGLWESIRRILGIFLYFLALLFALGRLFPGQIRLLIGIK